MDKRDRNGARKLAIALILLSAAVNRFTLGFLSIDVVAGTVRHAVVLLAQTAALAVGIALLRRPSRERAFTIALVGFGISMGLIILEAGVRLRYFGWAGLSPAAMNHTGWLRDCGYLQAPADPEIGWELKPNLNADYYLAPLRTNSVGMCDTEHAFEKPIDEFRIAVLGDSFTMPQGVPVEDAWFNVLATKLNAAHFAGDKRVVPLNFGVAGYDLPQYLAVLEHKALAYHPDLVLVGFCGSNDDLRPTKDPAAKLRPTGTLPPVFRSYLLELLGIIFFPEPNRSMLPRSPEDLDFVDKEFAQLAAICAQQKLPVVIAYLAFHSSHSAEIEALAKKHGFTYINCAAQFPDAIDPQYATFWPFDTHPNAKAHGMIAEAILPVVKERAP